MEDEFRKPYSLEEEAALLSGFVAGDTSVSFSMWQQDGQTVAGLGVV